MIQIHRVLQHWHVKFHHLNITYDEILSYFSDTINLYHVGETLCVSSLILGQQYLMKMKTDFVRDFESLNILLLCCVPGQLDAKWCTFPSLVEEYGICLRQEEQNFINSKVDFPGHRHQIPEDQLSSPINISDRFITKHGISLRVHKSVTLKELSTVVQNIDHFQQPLLGHLKMLIFFKLNRSFLFDKYLRYYLAKSAESFEVPQDTLQFDDIGFSIDVPFAPSSSCEQTSSQFVTMSMLVNALQSTCNLIDKIMNGTAAYYEITVGGSLKLEQLEIEREFTILSNYMQVCNLSCTPSKGLDGVQVMLELFQYTTHIKNIRSVCEQYHLENCLRDERLQELSEIMQHHTSEEDRSNTTPAVARDKMKRVKHILYQGGEVSSKCLDIFAAMADSAAFYQFVRDKQFYGPQGLDTFLQQYQLITAQLQHEEYDEQVLNHLLAAFKVISPFMDTKSSLAGLMQKVTALNVDNGLKQLETVNKNITLIRLWFSRAEVSLDVIVTSMAVIFCYTCIIIGRYYSECCKGTGTHHPNWHLYIPPWEGR